MNLQKIITGTTKEHIEKFSEGIYLHKEIHDKFSDFVLKAKYSGFIIKVISSFRTFNTQLKIWNEKATGKRPILDADGNIIDTHKLNSSELIFSILKWTALPGTSRHHWGTDIDVVAENLCPINYKIKLTPDEGKKGGVFYEFNEWLNNTLPLSGFYRPYRTYRGGVESEWWHLSYAPLSNQYLKQLTPNLVELLLKRSHIKFKEQILEKLTEIFEKFVLNIDTPNKS